MAEIEGSTKVSIEIDLDALMRIGDIIGEDEDGNAILMPTFYDNLTSACVEKILKSWETRSDLHNVVKDVIEERAQTIILNTLDQKTRPTNQWGEPTTEHSVSLRDVITTAVREQLDAWMKIPSSYDRKSAFKAYIEGAVQAEMYKELRPIVDKAKKDLRAALEASAASMIADAVKALSK